MEFTSWMDILFAELPLLWECVKDNAFPTSFFSRVFGMSAEMLDQIPVYLTGFIGLYLLCGAITVLLRFVRKQRSINSLSKQLVNIILTTCCILMVPLLPMLIKAIPYVIQHEVPPLQGTGDLFRFAGDCFGKTFYLIMAAGAVAATIWLPLGGALTYLKRYQLFGLPHMLFDYGTGIYLICIYLLSAYRGQMSVYLLIIPAVIMLRIIQIGGYIPEEVNAQAAVTGQDTLSYAEAIKKRDQNS